MLALLPDDKDAAPRSPLQRLGDIVLTRDRRQRRCIKVLLLSVVLYGVSVGLMAYGGLLGIVDPTVTRWLGSFLVLTLSTFYLIMRSGANLRLREPTMSLPQAFVAQSVIATGYAFTGPIHASTLMLYMLVIVFGLFDMRVNYGRIVTAYTLVLAGAVMIWRSHTMPQLYIAQYEIIYFALLATGLGVTSRLSLQLSTMRARLKSHKAELESALAHIQELATHDELTGLANRRHILTLLAAHAKRQARGGPSFYVAMADLDHFKRISDTHGHGVGDDALRTFAREAIKQLRNTDVIGRWGGEEFLLLMPETPPGDPNMGIERLRSALATCPASEQVPALRVRFSLGIARYRDGEAIDDTIERADRAVYAAKEAGRNCTVAL